MRAAAGELLPQETVQRCGHAIRTHNNEGKYVEVLRNEATGRAHYNRLVTCKSVWFCPVCAARIAEERRKEVQRLVKAHTCAGGLTVMVTLTAPHNPFDKCEDLRLAIRDSWRSMQQGRAWQAIKPVITGTIRSLEVTHGPNGWHPHFHILFLIEPDAGNGLGKAFGTWALGNFIWERWKKLTVKHGLGAPSVKAFDLSVCQSPSEAGEYVSKWGPHSEMTKQMAKTAKVNGTNHRNPFQILADYASAKSEADARLFQDYALSFKGSRQLTYSKELRSKYGLEELDDADLPVEPKEARPVMFFTDRGWRQVRMRRLQTAVLDAAEALDGMELISVLESFGLARQEMFPAWNSGLQTFTGVNLDGIDIHRTG